MRLIDADALMEAIGIADECKDCPRHGRFGCKEDSAFAYACEEITDAPTVDAVHVVRCKDCKWKDDYGCAIKIVDESDKPKDNDFCSFGERRTDAD